MLHARLGVDFECFASPLNCRYGRFCSAFADVDGAFGSAGSFLDFAPARGSFEANPPFVPELMGAAADRIEELLAAAQKADEPLSFTVIVPSWKQCHYFSQLSRSPWLKKYFEVEAADHIFCDGAQHVKTPAQLHRPSSFGSTIFFLQSAAGAKKWPVTEDLRADMLAAIASSAGKKSGKQVLSLQEWESKQHGAGAPRAERTAHRGRIGLDGNQSKKRSKYK